MERTDLTGPDGRRCTVLGVAQGLLSEADAVEDALHAIAPAVIALQLDPDQVADVSDWEPMAPEAPEDVAYAEALGTFGEVALPPPDLVVAHRLGTERGIPVHGIDVGELAWTEEFTRRVPGMALIKRGLRMRRGARKLKKASTPEALCRMWDARANRAPFAGLEAWREAEMAANIAEAVAAADGPVAVVLEVARTDGVLAALRTHGFT